MEKEVSKSNGMLIIGVGLCLAGFSFLLYQYRYDTTFWLPMFFTGLYLIYRGTIEFTNTGLGFSMPNGYKVLIAIAGMLAVASIGVSFMGISLFDNLGDLGLESIDSFFDAFDNIISTWGDIRESYWQYFGSNYAANWAENLEAIIDAIIRIFEWLKTELPIEVK